MKFAVFTDLHYDAIHDGDRRINELCEALEKENVDFVIELGDLCHPISENKQVVNRLKMLGVPCFFTVGNHNSDRYPIDVVLDFYDMERGYYSFVYEHVKFIVLDANYIKTSNGNEPYYKRNYAISKGDYPYIPLEEIDWLRNELASEEFHYVIFSHQSLYNELMKRGIGRVRLSV